MLKALVIEGEASLAKQLVINWFDVEQIAYDLDAIQRHLYVSFCRVG
jgi:hypothetical protein